MDKEKKKGGKLRKIASGIVSLAVIIILFQACTGSFDQAASDATDGAYGSDNYVDMVQTGYFGEFTDATVKEILDMNFGLSGFTQDWVSSDMDGKEYVAFYSYESGQTPNDGTTILFRICSDETFKVSGYAQNGNENFESAEIADFLNNWYMNWYVKNKIGEGVSESETMEKIQELIHNQLDNVSGIASLYGASRNYSGNRGNLCKKIDNIDPMDAMTVTELMNYYNGDMLDIYAFGKSFGNTEEGKLSGGTYGYSETLYPIEGGDDIISLYTNENGNLCVWYGNTATEEEYYSNLYDSYTFDDNVMRGYFGNDMDEFDFMEDGNVDVLLSGYGSTHYQSYMTEEAYFDGTLSEAGTNEVIYVKTDDELKEYLRDDTYIGSTFQFPAYMLGGTNIDNKYFAYIGVEDTTGHNGPVAAYITDPGVKLFAGDYILFTGVYEGVYGNGFLKFVTVSVQLQ